MHIDLVDRDIYANAGPPHDQLAWLRAHSPIHWHEGDPGFWAVTRYEDVVHVSRHSDLFSSHRKLALFEDLPEDQIALQRLMMLNQDPPEHTRRRSLVNRGFTPRTIGALEQHIRDICDDLLDKLTGEIDFVTEVAAPLPLYVICELLGAPATDRDKLFNWSNRMIGSQDPDYAASPEEGSGAAMEVYAYANQLAAQRKANPKNDIVTKLLQPDEHGETLSEDEFDLFVLLLVVAGNETTRNGASGGMLALFEHPDQWARLVADPTLAKTAADEIVRWVSPVNLFRRTSTTDQVLGGQEIKENDKVVVFYSSANRDSSVFPNADTFDIGRDPNPHIGFGGGGAHFCLGNHLAKLELRVLFEQLARRHPRLRQTGEARRLRSNFINGIKELPVTIG
ncbi:putative cytochrome P450 hydroxylase [[Actinomadura] parvosata subsp. kistnae]|uniref:Cytochrome P450 n=1 Tax=Nonomuraea composti TaxID=2720023 RepID=A0ABX1B163_9ACTN|nr:cytochrome P450 [Nonomuraea sp. ATCC 55076]NJP90305.1 cytochrome P450 [Nonomuraea sp. FMUSA5-5]SPL92433.1 putative cytochrome P450 hydroxylase [Actinomadura parvosata subsp. kistnae]